MSTTTSLHHDLDLTPEDRAALNAKVREAAENPKPSSGPEAPWARLDTANGGRFVCVRCGVSYRPTYPCPISVISAAMLAFHEDHVGCQPHPEGDMCVFCDGRGHVMRSCLDAKVLTKDEWWRCKDTGTSSKTIWLMMTGRFHQHQSEPTGAPHDPDDFGRCYRLLKRFPEWRVQIVDMGFVPGWEKLAENWGELEALYEEELPSGKCAKLYARMRELSGE